MWSRNAIGCRRQLLGVDRDQMKAQLILGHTFLGIWGFPTNYGHFCKCHDFGFLVDCSYIQNMQENPRSFLNDISLGNIQNLESSATSFVDLGDCCKFRIQKLWNFDFLRMGSLSSGSLKKMKRRAPKIGGDLYFEFN